MSNIGKILCDYLPVTQPELKMDHLYSNAIIFPMNIHLFSHPTAETRHEIKVPTPIYFIHNFLIYFMVLFDLYELHGK
jgi:hypothetical protein